jgi:hypothetical protein
MALEVSEQAGGKVLEVRVSDKLVKADYEQFVPEVERLIQQHGRIRVLFDMRDFHGWTMGALWEDMKFDLKHFKDIERLAVIGEKKWQEWMTTFCRPFTTAEIRYFDHSEVDQARSWLERA